MNSLTQLLTRQIEEVRQAEYNLDRALLEDNLTEHEVAQLRAKLKHEQRELNAIYESHNNIAAAG